MDRIFAYIQFTENTSLEAADSMEVQPPSHPARKEPESEKNYHCQILFLFRERLCGGGSHRDRKIEREGGREREEESKRKRARGRLEDRGKSI